MNDTVQLIAVLAIVTLAVGFVLRRAWRQHKGRAPACGQCDACRGKGG